MDMLDILSEENKSTQYVPLAERMKPRDLSEFFGQEKYVRKHSVLYNMIENSRLTSVILYGPSGVGKTSLAKIISEKTGSNFMRINAVSAGVSDIREAVEKAKLELSYGTRTILFIDEIHRFNKKQQDALLPYVENGIITLIGATTENPFFKVNSALTSRMTIIPLDSLDFEAISSIVKRALQEDVYLKDLQLSIEEEALSLLSDISGGDARKALNTLEMAVGFASENAVITEDDVLAVTYKNIARYDRDGDSHFDVISAFIKSIRGSDPDAALHYLARMIVSGEDLDFIARRLVISASEDIGNADPMALVLANSAMQAAQFVGFPEARIPLAQATTYLALAPKSNRAYMAINEAISDVESGAVYEVPAHLRDGSYSGAKSLGRGLNYKYPHDYGGGFVVQDYMPEKLRGKTYYQPTERGKEKYLKQYLDITKKR